MNKNSEKKKIIVDLIKVRNLACGLGQFSFNQEKFFATLEAPDFEFIFLVPPGYPENYADRVTYLHAREIWKYFPFLLPKADIWYSNNQQFHYLRKSKHTKHVITVHDLNFLVEKVSWKAARYLRRLSRSVKNASAVTVISDYVKNDLVRHIPAAATKVKRIYNGIERIDVQPASQPSFYKGRPFFFTIGQIRPKKNFHVLLDVMKAFPEYDLYITGDDKYEYAASIRQQIKEKDLTNVWVTGPVRNKEKIWLYRNCEAFLFPSTLEGFGIPPLEAMQFGKAVFSSRCTSLEEICNGYAFLWDNFEPDHMSQVIRENLPGFYENTHRIEQIKQYAFSFTYEKQVSELLELFRKL